MTTTKIGAYQGNVHVTGYMISYFNSKFRVSWHFLVITGIESRAGFGGIISKKLFFIRCKAIFLKAHVHTCDKQLPFSIL
jgi:hypothetical protein